MKVNLNLVTKISLVNFVSSVHFSVRVDHEVSVCSFYTNRGNVERSLNKTRQICPTE